MINTYIIVFIFNTIVQKDFFQDRSLLPISVINILQMASEKMELKFTLQLQYHIKLYL